MCTHVDLSNNKIFIADFIVEPLVLCKNIFIKTNEFRTNIGKTKPELLISSIVKILCNTPSKLLHNGCDFIEALFITSRLGKEIS